jgi:hypothetical protein
MAVLRDGRTLSAARIFGAFCVVALAGGCADSTINKPGAIADVQTLSLDAKQRVVFAGDRFDKHGRPERVLCTEPMPDALVARAAVLAASGNFAQPQGISAGGGISGGSSESAASIGFRNETVQMLRDGYYRLCEAYMNGALTRKQYQHMILNADTFMVVISALQTLGTNPVAPAVGISTGNITANVPAGAGQGTPGASASTAGSAITIQTLPNPTALPQGSKNAEMAALIVRAYLNYRMTLGRELAREEARDRAERRRKSY